MKRQLFLFAPTGAGLETTVKVKRRPSSVKSEILFVERLSGFGIRFEFVVEPFFCEDYHNLKNGKKHTLVPFIFTKKAECSRVM